MSQLLLIGSSHITVNNSGHETAAVTLSISENAVGLTEMAGITRGSIITGDANGDPSYLSLGTQNRVIQVMAVILMDTSFK